MPGTRPPMEFLLFASEMSLGDFEMAALNRAARLRKQIRVMIDQLNKEEADAIFARWIKECRAELLELGRTAALQITLDFVGVAGVEPGASYGATHGVNGHTDPV